MTSKIRGRTLRALCAAMVMATLGMSACHRAEAPLKIGFLVKMPEQAWFINEQKAAIELGKKEGFSVVSIGTPDGEKVLAAIDNLGAQGAQGAHPGSVSVPEAHTVPSSRRCPGSRRPRATALNA